MTVKDYLISNEDFYIDDSICYFDIETLGFDRKKHAVILICAAFKHHDSVLIRQYFADTESDEYDVLRAFNEDTKKIGKFITFNGDGFDIPFLSARFDLHNMKYSFDKIESFDILKFIRPLKSVWELDNLKLKTVEQFFGIKRHDLIDGAQSIRLYHEYQKTQDDICRSEIMLHNFEDVKHMLILHKAILHYLNEQTFDLNVYRHVFADNKGKSLMIPVYIYKVTLKKNLLQIELNSSLKDLSLQVYTDAGHSLIAEENRLIAKIYVSSGIDERGCSVCYIRSEENVIPLAVDKTLLNKNIITALNRLF